MAELALPRRIARSVAATDWAAVRWVIALRTALVCAGIVGAAVAVGDRHDAVAVGLGAIFTGLGDPRGAIGLRVRGMGLTAVGMAFAAFLGLLVSDSALAHVLLGLGVAFACGYVGVAGPRAALAGMVALVMFAVYAGTPQPLGEAVRVTVLLLLGGLAVMLATLLPLLLRRMGGVRADLAIAYRGLALAVRSGPRWLERADPLPRLATARDRRLEAGPEGATAAWFATLEDGLAEARLGLIALDADRELHDDAGRAATADLEAAAVRLLLRMAAAIELPWRSRGVAEARVRLEQAADAADAALPPHARGAVGLTRTALARTAEAMAGPLPIGRRGHVRFRLTASRDPLVALWRRIDPDRVMLRHGVRLAIAFAFATITSRLLPFDHAYWFPMTVAWMMKPDFAGTVVRLTSRVVGVILGASAVALIVLVTGRGDAAIVAMVAASALVFIAFVLPNYAIATGGITAYVVALLLVIDDPLVDTYVPQVASAIAAGVVVATISYLWPTRTTRTIAADLAAVARSTAAQVALALDPSATGADRRVAARAQAAAARLRAHAVVTAALHETGDHRLAGDPARRILDDLARAEAIAIAVELGVEEEHPDGADPGATAALEDLAERLEHLHDTGVAPARGARPPALGPRLTRLVDDAHAALDGVASS